MDQLIKTIYYQNKEITLVGTAHVSTESVKAVENTIIEYQPDVICLELDENRYQSLSNQSSWQKTDLFYFIKNNQVISLLIQLYLTAYQKNIAERLDTTPGQEMKAASNLAKEMKIPIRLIDRDIQITFKRLFAKLSTKEKIKLVSGLLQEDNEAVSEEDVIALMAAGNLTEKIKELETEFPALAEVILYERNSYMIEKIRSLPYQRILVVLGAAHLPGVIAEFETKVDLNKLIEIPKKKFKWMWLKWLLPIIIITMIVYGFTVNIQLGLRHLFLWVFINGGFAALFAIIAGAHPLSILVAFLAAPFTSINPFLACGFLVSLVELKLRPATVKDFESIFEDINHLKGWYQNKALRALFIFIMSNLGSTIGTFVSASKMIISR